MIIILSGLAGALYGGVLAYRRKGKPADIAQYTIAFAIAFALVGLFAMILINRIG